MSTTRTASRGGVFHNWHSLIRRAARLAGQEAVARGAHTLSSTTQINSGRDGQARDRTGSRRNEEQIKEANEPKDSSEPPSDGLWDRLVTGRVTHKFNLFAANMALARAVRVTAADPAQKAAMIEELQRFCDKYAAQVAGELQALR